MSKTMKFRGNAPAVLIAGVMVVVAGMALVSNGLFSGLTAEVEASQFELMKSILDSSLKSAESRALARADMIASLPRAKELVAARDREGLLAEYGEMFRIQKEKHGVDQAQFHIPPAVSLLRLHAPDQFGDDLTKFRPMVVAVNQYHQVRKGLAIARTGPALFGVVPMSDAAGQHLGSFEFGIDFGPVADNLKAAFGLELVVFIEEEPLREFAKGISGDVLNEQNRVGKYLKFHSTNWALMRGLATPGDLAALDEPVTFTRDALGKTYGVLLSPLRNGQGQGLGVMGMAMDFSGSRAAAGRSLVWQATLAVGGIVLLAGLILVVLRGFVLRPLGVIEESFAALAAGDRERRIEGAEGFCEELQGLARSHEELRTQGKEGRA